MHLLHNAEHQGVNVEYLLQKEPFLVNEKNVVKYSLRDYPYQERSIRGSGTLGKHFERAEPRLRVGTAAFCHFLNSG